MAVKRLNGVISGSASMEAEIVDAMGGGLCDIHGKYYGHGKHDLLDCPKCDIEQYFKPIGFKDIHGAKLFACNRVNTKWGGEGIVIWKDKIKEGKKIFIPCFEFESGDVIVKINQEEIDNREIVITGVI